MGVKEIYIDDLREEFVRDYVFPMFRANAIYEGTYLLGTSIARPLIAKRQIEIAREVGADAVCHGATGKGNDQVRFELGYYGLKPDVKVIAPWREWDPNSRTKLLAYAEEAGIPVAQSKKQEAPYSMDANLLHISYEGNALEDPWEEYSEDMFTRSVSPENAPDEPTYIEIDFETATPSPSTASACPRRHAHRAQQVRWRQRHRPPRHRRISLRRHEVSRRVRDPRRYYPHQRASRR